MFSTSACNGIERTNVIAHGLHQIFLNCEAVDMNLTWLKYMAGLHAEIQSRRQFSTIQQLPIKTTESVQAC